MIPSFRPRSISNEFHPRLRFLHFLPALALLALLPLAAFAQSKPDNNFDDIAQRASEAWAAQRYADAANFYDQALRIKPRWSEGWGYLAASLYNQKRYAEARDAYRRTTELTPQNGPSWAYVGLCEYELRQYRESFEDLNKAKKLDVGPDQNLQGAVRYRLGLLWDTAGKFELGMKELAWFADKNDASPDVLTATGLNVLRMPIFPDEIPSSKKDLIFKAGQAGWDINAHHLEEARAIFAELVAAHSREPNLHYAYGSLLALLDQESAVKQFQAELELTPNHIPALVQNAFLYLKMGQLDNSEALARRAMKLDPDNFAPHNILGRVLVEKGDLTGGIRELETAGKLAPKHPGNHFNLAQAYQRAGRKADAAREFATFDQLNRQAGPPSSDSGSGNQ